MIEATKNLSVFKKRLRELRGNRTLKEVADELGISRASLGFYEDGSRKPDIEVLVKIADYYNVSADYLLGISDTPSTDTEIKTLSDNFGINLRNAGNLKYFKKNTSKSDLFIKFWLEDLNWMIDTELLDLITTYLHFSATHFYVCGNKEETLCPIADLDFFDETLNLTFENDYDYLTQSLLVIIQEKLSAKREKNMFAHNGNSLE